MRRPDKARPVKDFDALDQVVGAARTVTSGADVPPKRHPRRPTKSRAERSRKSKPAAEGMQRATFDLPVTFHKRLKLAAVQEERPMRDLVEEALASYLKTKRT